MHRERFRLYREKASSPDRKWTKDLSRHFSKQGEWMGNEHVNRGSTSVAVRESGLDHKAVSLPPVKLAKVKTQQPPVRARTRSSWAVPLRARETVRPLWPTVWQFLTGLNIHLTCDPMITIPGAYHRKMKTYIHTDTCTTLLLAALSVIDKHRKQPRCPSWGDWIHKSWNSRAADRSASNRSE